MKTSNNRIIGRVQKLILQSSPSPRSTGSSSAAPPTTRFRVYTPIAILLACLMAISVAQDSARQSSSDKRVAFANTYGSVKYSSLYTEQRSRDSDVFLGPNGEMVYTRLPRGAKRITVNGRSYYRKGDTFYYRHFFGGSYVYTEGPPPIGLTISRLPGPYSIETYDGTRYYVSGEVYYVKELRGYRVVPSPRR